jgi:hypothetical protein
MASSKSLYNIVNGLRYFGVGSKVTRNIYKFPDTYWVITRVKLSKDQEHGNVYGRLVWRGRAQERDTKINTALKRQWNLVSTPNYSKFKGASDDVASLIPEPLGERTC